MRVQVDEARRNHEPAHVEDRVAGEIRVDRDDLPALDRDVADRVEPALGIDHAAALQDEQNLSSEESRKVSGLMRINHTGEVCAQALYQGQALTAKLASVREAMHHAAQEEVDHLQWCEERLGQLNSHTSYLNPLWYGLSFSIGALAGAAGDKWSLGFVAATENRVCRHLNEHLAQLPSQEDKSRAILEQMLIDEGEHEALALASGGVEFSKPAQDLMSAVAKVMTSTTYYL